MRKIKLLTQYVLTSTIMDKYELRIGNSVLLNGKITHVSCGKDLDWGDFEPIYITEKWLLKLGLEKLSELEFSVEIDNGWTIIYQSSHYVYIKYNDVECEISHFKYEYVHQLQNLCFALTGKELACV